MRKIYDCFTFYNEYDLLELRLRELYDHVDHFVIAEANVTHSHKPKPYNFLDNIERYKPWADKIIYVKVEDMPGITEEIRHHPNTGVYGVWQNYWHNERHQRNCLVRGLVGATDDDIIIVSDVDEMIRGECIDNMRQDTQHNLWSFRMPMFNYKFNYMWTQPLIFQVQGQAFTIARAKTFPNLSWSREVYGRVWVDRSKEYDDGVEKCYTHAGWHFSSLGDSKHVANKLLNVADYFTEEAKTINIDTLIDQRTSQVVKGSKFEPVVLDDYFPKYIVENQDRYKDFILTDGTETVLEKLSVIDMNSNIQY